MAKLSKSQIAKRFTYELSQMIKPDKLHSNTVTAIEKWLSTKWHPAIDNIFQAPMNWENWKDVKIEWTPIGLDFIVIMNDKSRGFKVFIKGAEHYSDSINQLWQDGLGKLSQSQVNEVINAPQLFPLNDYNKKDNDNAETGYSHEDG